MGKLSLLIFGFGVIPFQVAGMIAFFFGLEHSSLKRAQKLGRVTPTLAFFVTLIIFILCGDGRSVILLCIFLFPFLIAVVVANVVCALVITSLLAGLCEDELPSQTQQQQHVAPRVVAWYKPEQWEQLRNTAADPDRVPTTFEEWHVNAKRRDAELAAEGFSVEKVFVDIPTMLNWLRAQGRKNTTEDRLAFAYFHHQQMT